MPTGVSGVERVLAEYLSFLELERRLSVRTRRAYERDVRACLAFLAGAGFGGLEGVRVRDLRAFLAQEALSRPSASSQSRATAALKSFFGFCEESEVVSRNPAAALRTPKKGGALPDVLDRHELRLLAVPDRANVWKRQFAGRRERDRLLLALLAYGGLRRSELLGLDWDDVDLDRRLLRVRHAKGGHQRVIPIHSGLVALFDAYLAVRLPLRDRALFVGVQGARLNGTQLAQTFRHYVRASGSGSESA